MIRVDHAGERGADTIYNGQWDVLKDTESGDLIKVRRRAKPLTMNRVSRWIFCQMGDPTYGFLAYVGARKNPFGDF